MTELAPSSPSVDVMDLPTDAARSQEHHPAAAEAPEAALPAAPAPAAPEPPAGQTVAAEPPSGAPAPVEEEEESPAIAALAALVATTHLRQERWELALKADRRHDPSACLEDCLSVLAYEPDHRGARLLGARAARELRDWPQATRLLGEALAFEDGEDGEDAALAWDYLTAATVAGDEAAVASGVARLGLDADAWAQEDGFVFVVLDGRTHVARRTGAVAAEICSIAPGDRPQHVGDIVAFDPRPVATTAPLGAEHAHGPSWPTFRTVAILRAGNRQVWTARGVDPGFAAWEDAVDVVSRRGWVLRRDAAADRSVTDVLGRVALPAEVDPVEVLAVLTEATAGWPSPVAWHG